MKPLLILQLLIFPFFCLAQYDEVSDSIQWNIKALDTGRNEDYMTKREKDMLREINMVRAYPQKYIPFIQEHIRIQRQQMDDAEGEISYTTSTVTINGKKTVTVESVEGRAIYEREIEAAEELIEELKKATPLSILKPLRCLYLAATRHGKDCVKVKDMQHEGSDGSNPWDRINDACPERGFGNENLAAGPSTVRQIVINLLVDGGISTRGHRYNMLDKNWIYGACYETGKVGIYPTGWVQNFVN